MKGKLLAFGICLLAVATIGIVQATTKAVDSSRDCDQYAVIRCGTLNAGELRNEYETNNGSNANGDTTKQGDIRQIFSAMGISKAAMDAKPVTGVVYKDGTVKTDVGKVVATGAMMAARGLGGSQIAGTNAQKVSVSAMSEAQTAMIWLDKNGTFLFAVMKPCGNPVSATPKEEPKPEPQPVAKCVDVKATQIERNKYSVTAKAQASAGAKIKGYNLTVTKGTATIVDKSYATTAESQTVVYQDLQPGDYKVKATVDTTEGTKGGENCKTTFTVAEVPVTPPTPTPGIKIEKYVDNDKKYLRVNADVEFSYRIVVTNTGTSDLEDVLVTDTAASGITLLSVSPPSGSITAPNSSTPNYSFKYTIPTLLKGETRTFVLTAKVPVAQAGKLLNTVCVDAPSVTGTPDGCDTAEVEVPPTPVPGKLEVCVINEKVVRMVDEADVKANPSLYSTDMSLCDDEEVLPAELPETGPAEAVLSAVGAMSLVGASAYYVASRRNA